MHNIKVHNLYSGFTIKLHLNGSKKKIVNDFHNLLLGDAWAEVKGGKSTIWPCYSIIILHSK